MLQPKNGPGRKDPLASLTEAGHAYSYAKPTEKPTLGKPAITSNDIADYNIPAIDTQTARRNFPGYSEAQYYSAEEVWSGDTSGTTDTDSTISDQGDESRTRIYSKQGPKGRPTKRS